MWTTPKRTTIAPRVLDRHRGWLERIGLFQGLPRDLEWTLVALTPEEVLAMRYIDCHWWLELSDGTRDPRVAADRIRRGLVSVRTSNPTVRSQSGCARRRRRRS
jgi:hypothetical protein